MRKTRSLAFVTLVAFCVAVPGLAHELFDYPPGYLSGIRPVTPRFAKPVPGVARERLLSGRPVPRLGAEFSKYLLCAAKPDCLVDLQIFEDFLLVYRAPLAEDEEVIPWLRAFAAEAEARVWGGQKIEFAQDSYKNVLIRVPATGVYRERKAAPILLQAHADMVLTKADAMPGEDVRDYFRLNGVTVAREGDWLVTKNRYTSMGADNGIGVAAALRFLVDPSLAHPPLELLFTSGEEVGLVGAMKLNRPDDPHRIRLTSKVGLNLDGLVIGGADVPSDSLTLIRGSMGGAGYKVHTKVAVTAVPAGFSRHRFTLTGLLGGHSGGDIHKDRVSTVFMTARFFEKLGDRFGDSFYFTSVRVGDLNVFNRIPNSLVLEFASDGAASAEAARAMLNEIARAMILAAQDEEHEKFKIEFEAITADVSGLSGISGTEAKRVGKVISATKNGVLDLDPAYPFANAMSSNVAAMFLEPAKTDFNLSFAFLSRAYENARFQALADEIRANLAKTAAVPGASRDEQTANVDAWQIPADHWLIRLAQTEVPAFRQVAFLPGGIEPGVIANRYPDLGIDLVSIGPTVRNPHTVMEQLNLATYPAYSDGLVRLIHAIANARR